MREELSFLLLLKIWCEKLAKDTLVCEGWVLAFDLNQFDLWKVFEGSVRADVVPTTEKLLSEEIYLEINSKRAEYHSFQRDIEKEKPVDESERVVVDFDPEAAGWRS